MRLLVALLALTLPLCADLVLIDFEALAEPDVITNQFPGVSFTNAAAWEAGVTLNEFEAPPRSGSVVAAAFSGPMILSFSTPVSYVGGYFNYETPLTLRAFDIDDNEIASLTSVFGTNLLISGDPGSSPNELLQFTYNSGISRITIDGTGTFTVDDIAFNPIPEPSGIVLLTTVAIGLYLTSGKLRARL